MRKIIINGNEDYILKLLCYAKEKICEEKINFCFFSKDFIIKTKKDLSFNLTIEVNEDEDDEKLNKKIGNKDFLAFTRDHKLTALEMVN